MCRLLALKDILVGDMGFDYVFFDISSSLNYSSINAVVSSDYMFLVRSQDKSDVLGTNNGKWVLFIHIV